MASDGLTPASDQGVTGQQPKPTDPARRIDAIDALRGIALFGVLAINLVMGFRVSIFEQFLSAKSAASPVDRVVETILILGIDMKAFALFSMLFGAGLAIQFERLSASPRRARLLIRRLAVLLAIGLLHLCLIWYGDILTEYALAGLIVLPFLWGPRWLLACGALSFLALYLLMQAYPPAGLFPATATIASAVAEENRVYATGGFADALALRLRELPLILPLHVYIFPRTIGLFLLGAYVWRTGLLRTPRQGLMFSIAAVGIVLGATLTILSHVRGLLFSDASGTILLALGYAAAIIGIANLKSGKMLLGWAAPLGRMAFTSYLAQSLIFGWIFYGYGLGLFGRLGAASALAIGIAVYVGQVLFSAWWLRRYRYGPVEWLWRTLMYGVRQPMLHSPIEAVR
ncbi:permease [Bradyrhizobium sp. CCBAU 051011]|jgi:uncharacterized protein|uniref:DUF418 domain-containing protein n=1 Tax=Bradyrhizobium sp. CCBAU 051011 TaxID=858422 RepID=UPI001373E71F|nr:DUF418 domain-containing protein [Bradyrhizobium sp. CCBAU 051011]QHO74404.1 permease [Bradyrhizobium sp. CCBAU 051011]